MAKQTAQIKNLEETIKATVAKLKTKYPKVHVLRVDLSKDDAVIGYLKDPARDIMGYFLANAESNPVVATETLLRDCLISPDSDPRIVEDNEVFYSCIAQVNKLISLKKSSLTTY